MLDGAGDRLKKPQPDAFAFQICGRAGPTALEHPGEYKRTDDTARSGRTPSGVLFFPISHFR